MAAPTNLSIDEIRNFILSRGGKVTNHDLVKHFKPFLTNAETRDIARETFKKYVNILGSIKYENGEKFIVLKEKRIIPEITREPPPYIPPPVIVKKEFTSDLPSPKYQDPPIVTSVNYQVSSPDVSRSSVEFPDTPKSVYESNVIKREKVPSSRSSQNISDSVDNVSISSSTGAIRKQRSVVDMKVADNFSPPSPDSDRFKSVPELRTEKQDYVRVSTSSNSLSDSVDSVPVNSNFEQIKRIRSAVEEDKTEKVPHNTEGDTQISVKDRLKTFNKIQEKAEFVGPSVPESKYDKDSKDEDRGSVVSLRPAAHEWMMKAVTGDYAGLAKLASEDRRLVFVKDPILSYTALHWAAKHGNVNIAKLVLGKCPEIVNYRSGGGYTALHIAMQSRHEDIYDLLTKDYNADETIRDYSGKKARQYAITEDTSVSAETYRKIKKIREKKKAEKDTKFLRIGSLNLRVKKTTHAFSNFLGYGSTKSNHKFSNKQFPSYPHGPARPGDTRSWGSGGALGNHHSSNDMEASSDTLSSNESPRPMRPSEIKAHGSSHMFSKQFPNQGNSVKSRDTNHNQPSNSPRAMRPSEIKACGSGHIFSDGQSPTSPHILSPNEITWGSVDNLQSNQSMQPPQSNRVMRNLKKRNSEFIPNSQSKSTPCTPSEVRSILGADHQPAYHASGTQDSDSDSACGFDAQWQYKGFKK